VGRGGQTDRKAYSTAGSTDSASDRSVPANRPSSTRVSSARVARLAWPYGICPSSHAYPLLATHCIEGRYGRHGVAVNGTNWHLALLPPASVHGEEETCLSQARFTPKRNRLRCVRCSFTQRTQRKRLRLDGNRALLSVMCSSVVLVVSKCFVIILL